MKTAEGAMVGYECSAGWRGACGCTANSKRLGRRAHATSRLLLFSLFAGNVHVNV